MENGQVVGDVSRGTAELQCKPCRVHRLFERCQDLPSGRPDQMAYRVSWFSRRSEKGGRESSRRVAECVRPRATADNDSDPRPDEYRRQEKQPRLGDRSLLDCFGRHPEATTIERD